MSDESMSDDRQRVQTSAGSTATGIPDAVVDPVTAVVPEVSNAIPEPTDDSDDDTSSELLVGYGRDILIVDDNAANLVAIEAALEPLGRNVVLARSGVEALTALLKQDFALILLDVQMPEMDGFETARLMRSRERYRSTPIIFVTGITWPEDTDLRGYQLGAFDFLMKPIRPEVLRAKAGVFIQLQERTIELHRKSEELRFEQQRAHENELYRASALQFQTLANTLPLLTWYSDPDGTVRWCNQRWYEYVGAPVGQLGAWGHGDAIDPVDLPRVLVKWRAALESGEEWEDVFRIRRHDGEYRWFLSRAVPLRNRGGKVVHWFGTNVDIDQQKMMEATAEAASRAKDEFLAMLGHELRNPLAPIQTALDLMRLRIPEVAEQERAVIERQVKHLTRLVDDLLDVSRITQGKIELRREPVELAEIVARAVELASPLLERKAHQLTVEVPERDLALRGDPTRLAQVVANVLTNAAKYTEPGGAVSIRAERVRDAEGDRIQLHIRDTGIGISQEMLQRVFELFAQERQAVDRAQGGLGLGLAIARSIVSMHGGNIRAHSEGLGRGSEFTIELPVLHRPTKPSQQAVTLQDAEARQLRILVVDDNQDAAELLSEALAKSGHKVQHAFDGPSALALLAGFQPDVAVLDLGLPVMDGYELVAQLRATLPPGSARYIAVTGYGQAEDRRRTKEAGFHLHLVKPINLKQVREAIKKVQTMDDGGEPTDVGEPLVREATTIRR
jgi:PAS domain S-box-containing protein